MRPSSGFSSVQCDASDIANVAVMSSQSLKSLSFPKLGKGDTFEIHGASNLESLHANVLNGTGERFVLEDTVRLRTIELGERFYGAYSDAGYPTFVEKGYSGYFNVTQEVINFVLGNRTAVPLEVEVANCDLVTHIDYKLSQAKRVTIRGNGDVVFTAFWSEIFDHYQSSSLYVDSLELSGIKEIREGNLDAKSKNLEESHVSELLAVLRAGTFRLNNNPKMKEAFVPFYVADLLEISNNPEVEWLRLVQATLPGLYFDAGIITLTHNDKLRINATLDWTPEVGGQYNGTSTTLAWRLVEGNQTTLQGYFDNNFL